MKPRFLFCVCIATLGMAIASTVRAEAIKVTYSSISWLQAPMWISRDAGSLKKYNLNVEFVFIPGGSLLVQTLLAGGAEIASLAPAPAILAWHRGADLVMVAGGIERVIQALVVKPQIRQVSELKGKKVGVSRFASLSDVSLREVLKLHNLPAHEVLIVQAGAADERLAALSRGALDASMFNYDQVDLAQKLGFKMLVDLREFPISYPIQGLVTGRKYLASNRDIVSRLVRSYVEGIRILKTDKEFSMATMGKQLRVSDRDILSNAHSIYAGAFNDPPYVQKAGAMNVIQNLGNSPAPPQNLDAFIDNSLIGEILKGPSSATTVR